MKLEAMRNAKLAEPETSISQRSSALNLCEELKVSTNQSIQATKVRRF